MGKNVSEGLFETYLKEQGYKFTFDTPIPGKEKVPDFKITHDEKDFLVEVKEGTADVPYEAGKVYGGDPLEKTRVFIHKAKEKFKEFDGWSCSLAIYQHTDRTMLLDPLMVLCAMKGDLGMTFRVNTQTGTAESQAQNVFMGGGRMQPKLNTGINAIIVINSADYLPVSYFQERNVRFKEKYLKLGRELTVHEGFEIACNLIQEPKERKKVVSMIVVENPHAAVPLSRELFRGPFDQRHVYEGTMLNPVYYGAEQKVYDDLEEEVKKYY